MAHRPPTCTGSSWVDRAERSARSTVEPVSGPGSEVYSAASSGKSHATSALSLPQSHPLMPRSAPVLVDTASGDGTPSRQPTCRRLGPPSVTNHASSTGGRWLVQPLLLSSESTLSSCVWRTGVVPVLLRVSRQSTWDLHVT